MSLSSLRPEDCPIQICPLLRSLGILWEDMISCATSPSCDETAVEWSAHVRERILPEVDRRVATALSEYSDGLRRSRNLRGKELQGGGASTSGTWEEEAMEAMLIVFVPFSDAMAGRNDTCLPFQTK